MKFRLHGRLDELKKEWTEAHRQYPRAVPAVTVAIAILPLLVVAAGLWSLVALGSGLPDGDTIRKIGDMQQSTAVFDASDQLAFTIYQEQRIEVPLSEISPKLIHALIDVEDQRFYHHHGFDLVRIGSAALANVRHRRAVQGGSTITQQLARQSFLRPDKTLHRKLQELILAARIERMYSKEEILALYLNKVYFGDGLYGVEAASRGYFGKHPSDLSVSHAALLARLVKSAS